MRALRGSARRMPGYSETKEFSRAYRGAVAAALADSWRVGLGVFSCAVAISVVVAYALPSVYESTATLEVTPEPEGGPGKPIESEIKSLLSDPNRIERMLRDPSVRPQSGPSSEELAASAKVVATSDRQFGLSYFAATPELAREGCAALSDTLVAHFSKRGTRAELERRTKALADFVNAHPDLLTEDAPRANQSSGATKPAVPPSDAAIETLRRQKAVLEAELAQQSATDPSHANPYDEGGPSTADLQRQLAEVRYAITTRQKAMAAAAVSASPPAPAAPEQTALQAQYKKLITEVVTAEHPAATGPASSPARIVRAPSLPDDPVKPNRPVIVGIGALVGIWLSVLAAVLKIRHGGRRRPMEDDEDELPIARVNPMMAPPVAAVPALGPRTEPSLPAPARETPKAPAVADAPRPLGIGGTQIGIMDPALVRTRIGGTPAELMMLTSPNGPDATPPPVETSLEPSAVRALPPVVEQPPQTLRGVQQRSPSDPPAQTAAAAPNPPAAQAVLPAQATVPPQGTVVAEAPRVLIPRPHSSHPPPRSPSDAPPAAKGTTMRPPAVPRTIDVFSPPDKDAPPNTQRMGTGQGSLDNFPRTISPPPPPPSVPPASRGDNMGTRYSFVDRNRSSRAPASARPPSVRPVADRGSRPPTGRVGTLVEVQDLAAGGGSSTAREQADVRPAAPPGEEPRAARATQPIVTSSGQAEVWEKKSSLPEPDEIVVSQPASSRWRMPPALTGGNGALAGLRDQILEFTSRGSFVVAVTSEQASVEGKTNVAAKLSGMLSHEDRARVLLVEANFDFPALHRVLSVEMPPGAGFSQQLRSRLRNGRKPWNVVHCASSLDVLAEGPVRSPGVLLSQEFANAIAELRTCYDVIVLDSPVAGHGVETKPINAVSDGIAIIAASQSVLRDVLERAMSRFGQKKLMVAIPATEA